MGKSMMSSLTKGFKPERQEDKPKYLDRVAGTYVVMLIGSIAEYLDRHGKLVLKSKVKILKPIEDGLERKDDDPKYDGHEQGSTTSITFWPGDYFSKNITPFAAACLGLTSNELVTACDGEISTAEVVETVFGGDTEEEPGKVDGMAILEVNVEEYKYKNDSGEEKKGSNVTWKAVNLEDYMSEDEISTTSLEIFKDEEYLGHANTQYQEFVEAMKS